MGEKNQTILERDPSDPKKFKALFFIIERLQIMHRGELHPTL